MAKTIKEMAETAYPKMSRVSEPHGIIPADYESHNLGDANEEKREGFITGANVVLKEIEKLLPDRWLSVGDGEKIKEKIKQLKGE